MPFPRSSGILLHPTSLPGNYGIGELGKEAYDFVDFLHRSSQRLWQILPLGPTGYGNSPYMSYSAIAGNPLLISLELLRERGLLESQDLENLPPFPLDRVDFDVVIPWKTSLLQKAGKRFFGGGDSIVYTQFDGFCRGNSGWLEDYALFMALLNLYEGSPWTHWPDELRHRHPSALQRVREELKEEILLQKFYQFEFIQQWLNLKRYANSLQVSIVGDIPIYVAHNSADVWSNPSAFKLDPETGNPTQMAGVPPDYFSATGQLWGNPIYDWKYLEKTDFDWWLKRVEGVLYLVDIIRIDHFRGLEAYWSVAAGETTAMNGNWIKAPGAKLFGAIKDKLGSLPIIAEDLGDIDEEVQQLRDSFGFPGMKILQFAFGTDSDNVHLPFNTAENSVIYSGTHDNNTTVGWYTNDANDYEKHQLEQYLGHSLSLHNVSWDLIRLAYSCVANQAIIPLQDVFSLGSDARMNRPSTTEGNWSWRYRREALTHEYSDRLSYLVKLFGRDRG
ncbi:MAG: 4-alpha-glucanotransferase [Chroococcopsis gigantea SAG 12.99]|jgi:4-alpha-glucanotransferase|nr:4-alpha-glucanotransferase [Chlorogloea purpurea SAG 13.99]MDV3000749.1 4-alpha-glucanotransferase [Chroococcopsis gigantea SAG 12.99]